MSGRADRLRAEWGNGTTAFVAAHPAAVRWLTGLAGEGHELYGNTPLWAVVGPEGPAVAVVPACELAWVQELAAPEAVRPYGRFVFTGSGARCLSAYSPAPPLEAVLRATLDELGAGELVAVDDGISYPQGARLARALAPRRLVARPDAPSRARRVKDEGELDLLRQVNRIAEEAVLAAAAALRPGVTERELLAIVRRSMVERGARPMLGSVGIGERGALVDTVASDRALRRGEPVRFDVGCVLGGYHADLSRTAVLGTPPAWVVETYGALLAGERAAIAAARPGVAAAALYDVAVRATRDAGLGDYDRTHCGHGIGLRIYEPPLVAPVAPGGREPPLVALGTPDRLEPGMTLCLETPLYITGVAGLQVEDAVAITADGNERLGRAAQDLVVVD
jgi:Xaa-Pro aminopeptidase